MTAQRLCRSAIAFADEQADAGNQHDRPSCGASSRHFTICASTHAPRFLKFGF